SKFVIRRPVQSGAWETQILRLPSLFSSHATLAPLGAASGPVANGALITWRTEKGGGAAGVPTTAASDRRARRVVFIGCLAIIAQARLLYRVVGNSWCGGSGSQASVPLARSIWVPARLELSSSSRRTT